MQETNWHNLSWQEVVKRLNSNSEKGLSQKEVRIRKEKFGLNLIPTTPSASKLKIFLMQFQSPLIYILVIAGLITLILGKWEDALVILLSVSINAGFGFWEESKVSKILEKLKKTLKTKAIVLREKEKKVVFQEELVVGDIIFLKAGDRVPADGRLIEAQNLKVSEAILTGEWIPSPKKVEILPKETSLADRENMIYMGSFVESGEGKAVVVAIGKETEAGKIATLIKETKDEKTPLQRRLVKFAKIIGISIAFISLFIFLGGLIRKAHLLEMFETSVAVAVGGIPEALPVVMTVILAVGAERILRKKGLIRKLASVETLGSTEIICFDKTRTLTQGRMELSEIVSENPDLTLKIAVLANGAFVENPDKKPKEWKIQGSPTDIALLKAGIKKGFLKPNLEKNSIELSHLPFDSTYKYQLSLRNENNKFLLYISGAPERILEKSVNQKDWSKTVEDLTKRGLRVIGVGYKEILNDKFQIPSNLNELASEFNFVGLIALKDPLRPDVKEAIRICKLAGMRPILVTGDHQFTAKAIAEEIGLKVKEENILTGKDLDRMSDKELGKKLEEIKVYARVEPRHKMKIIWAWQKKGKVVAMTGDGINDAPALKKADIGVALGSGTEVAKESSDLVLLNDSFSTIVKAVEEGRVILDNLRKSISYILADSFTSVILIGFANIILGWPLPILPAQILWNNFVEDTLPDISYAFEPEEEDVMKRKPSFGKGSLFNREMKVLIFATGLIDEFLMLILFYFFWKKLGYPIPIKTESIILIPETLKYIRTLVFGAICIDTAFVIYCYKSLRKNLWQINPFSNKILVISSIVVFVAFAAAVYFPPLQNLLQTVPLGVGSWLILIGVGLLSMSLIEITKWYFITRHEV